MQRSVTRALKDWLHETSPGTFDLVLAVDGEGLDTEAIGLLRSRFSGARFVLYLVDSVRNSPLCLDRSQAFDEVVSFDRADCVAHPEWRYRPLFAPDEYWQPGPIRSAGVAFVGSYHPERILVLRRWVARCRALGVLGDYSVLTRGWLDQLRWFPSHLDLDLSRIRRSLSADEACSRYRAFGTVLDIHHHHQTGLTMRTFEALACGCRLVTTNPMVVDEDFYDPEYVHVIDRVHPEPSLPFICRPLSASHPLCSRRYSAKGWALEVVGT